MKDSGKIKALRLFVVLALVLTANVFLLTPMASAGEDVWECLDTPLSIGHYGSLYTIEIPDMPIAKIIIDTTFDIKESPNFIRIAFNGIYSYDHFLQSPVLLNGYTAFLPENEKRDITKKQQSLSTN